jgi:serine/threonine protein phosphatase PrpC
LQKLNVEFGGYSNKGPKAQNQDAFAAWLPTDSQLESKGAVASIADGVSACSRAREAAVTCVTNFIQDYSQTPDTWMVKRAASRVLEGLNRWCHGQHDYQHDGHSQMVTTFSALVFKSTTGYLLHVGDSRIYRLQGKQFEQLTADHISRQGSNRYLTRAIGIDPKLDIDYRTFELLPQDVFLFSTDGVHEFLSSKQLQSLLGDASENLELAAEKIVQAALDAGSDDNVSCLLVRVAQLPSGDLDEYYRQLTRLAMPPALDIGMKLEGYRVLQLVFNGIRSSLYKVQCEVNGKIYGLKTPSQHFADDPVYLSGFLREEWIGQRVKHPNIMAIYSRPDNAKFMYHVCEYIEGQTLRQWMYDNPQPSLDQVRGIISQLIVALRVLERRDMVHRDVKPENVMITHQGEVKLIDFGTVWVGALAETNTLPVEDIALGSVHYIAPEYLITHHSDHRSDLFSLAVLCYEMLSGTLPFAAFRYQDYVPTHYSEWQYQSLHHRRQDLPAWINLSLRKALQADPALRYQAFSEFIADLAKPNRSLIVADKKQPLAQRNPLLMWQLISGFLLAVIVFLVANR